jgi:hypothetical protein
MLEARSLIGLDALMPRRSLRALTTGFVAALALLAGACGNGGAGDGGSSSGGAATSDWSAQALGKEAQNASVTPVVINSALGVGTNRLAIGLFDAKAQLVTDATNTRMRLFSLEGNSGTFVSEHTLTTSSLPQEGSNQQHADGSQHLHDAPVVTMYVTGIELPREGFWGAEIAFTAGGKQQRQRVRFAVLPKTPEPAIGAPAPASVQKTLRDGIPLADLDTSAVPQRALHELTIAEAVRSGKVSVIAFATPAFCQTRFCGPVVEKVVAPAAQKYGDRINAIHVEPFDVPAARSGTLKGEAVMEEWGLRTEPWVFVTGKDGRVFAKFEGVLSLGELTAAIDRALAAG